MRVSIIVVLEGEINVIRLKSGRGGSTGMGGH